MALLLAPPARAAVVAPSPGQQVRLRAEEALIVFDPLTSQQTVVVQHTFDGTTTPFGLLLATPDAARVQVVPERLKEAVDDILHPSAKSIRTLDIELHSWIGGLLVREVGDPPPEGDESPGRAPPARGEAVALGSAPEPVHDWVLANGFTLAPAQAAWLAEMRDKGWSVTGVVVQPPKSAAPPPTLRGPVLALTHPAEAPVFAAGMPPFAVLPGGGAALPPVDVAVLTEWAVSLATESPPEPYFADTLTGREVNRLGGRAGLPWAFRRDGTLTAFRLDRPPGPGILQFARAEPRAAIRPEPVPREKIHRFRVPIEVPVLVLALVGVLWVRSRRREPADGGHRIRL
jgi:hypothetical protein